MNLSNEIYSLFFLDARHKHYCKYLFTPHVHAQQRVKQSPCLSVCLSVCLSLRGPKILKQLKYAVIRSEKGTITIFELFFQGHNADSTIYDLWELQIPGV